jgi:hypothetical protein
MMNRLIKIWVFAFQLPLLLSAQPSDIWKPLPYASFEKKKENSSDSWFYYESGLFYQHFIYPSDTLNYDPDADEVFIFESEFVPTAASIALQFFRPYFTGEEVDPFYLGLNPALWEAQLDNLNVTDEAYGLGTFSNGTRKAQLLVSKKNDWYTYWLIIQSPPSINLKSERQKYRKQRKF